MRTKTKKSKKLLVWYRLETVDGYGRPLGAWERGPRPVPCADTWYRTGKTVYKPDAIKAARAAGWTGKIVKTKKGEVLDDSEGSEVSGT